MKYTFASLGKLESLGVRLGGAGLGNIMFPWATALVYAKNNNLQIIQTTWKNLKFGTFIRKERDKRMYMNLFSETDGISGFKKFFLLKFSNNIKVFSGMNDLFEPFKKSKFLLNLSCLKLLILII